MVLLSAGCSIFQAHAQTQTQTQAREYDLKATFLFSFSQFVEWPATAMADTNSPFVIGILGNDPFGGFLDDLVRNERVHDKPIRIKRFSKVEEALGTHILFISKSELPKTEAILEKLGSRPILTVGEAVERSFARRGGVIGLVTENKKIRVRINMEAADRAQLKISTKLLRIAEIVRTEKP
ncbi:MAG: hypothetical protein QOF48_1045 [Verrucomicrobiota bacterium]|jgi:hypothetical protein